MRLGFILGEIGSGLRRNMSMVISVILVTLVSLTFVGAAFMLQKQIDVMKGYWYDRIQVSIFLCNKDSASPSCAAGAVTDEQKKNIQTLLDAPDIKQYVKNSQFETQDEALQHFHEQYKDSPLDGSITVDQLQASFRIGLTDPEKYSIFQERFSSVPGVDQVVDQRKVLEPLFKVMNGATWFAVSIATLMTVAAALLVATTIRLSAFSRRRETGIMRLVGASKSVVQLPFILEGVIAAVIGAGLACVALWAFTKFAIQDVFVPANPGVAFISVAQVWWVGPILIGLSIVIAGLSSWLSLRKHLKV
ncbi:cell division transport system permease protein [Psychromicrobium silvestre]|uniref:Cell division protein FtsX n=1 Tax=Psychromicrobium silvestre TaxID=1645614 RepID=A0A7Y9LSN1_9MICC|nr:permease-like cell division protein FtsX [Psychromicrobium silvestre]NYE94873.1 cell division transport system permease protein [Psychromicrobium silvestre]